MFYFFLAWLIVLGPVLTVAGVTKLLASRKQRVPAGATTEALEAWLDAYDGVLDPFASVEEVDTKVFDALVAADKTLRQGQYINGRCAECGVTKGSIIHMSYCSRGIRTGPQYGHAPPAKALGTPVAPPKPSDHPHGSPSPACHCDKCNARYTEEEREQLEAQRSGERCPRCYRGRLRDGSSCDSCPYEEPPDGTKYGSWMEEVEDKERQAGRVFPDVSFACPSCYSVTNYRPEEAKMLCGRCNYKELPAHVEPAIMTDPYTMDFEAMQKEYTDAILLEAFGAAVVHRPKPVRPNPIKPHRI